MTFSRTFNAFSATSGTPTEFSIAIIVFSGILYLFFV
jgi:hypothetical protein